MSFNIAIDGPAGAGKSTIAKKFAEQLHFIYVDTGAMYRGMAYYFLENKIDLLNEELVCSFCPKINISIAYQDGLQHVLCNQIDVTASIRSDEIGNGASIISAYGCVRSHLLALQKKLAKEHDVIMDGRDIGSFVLPDADLKLYLTASVDCRAKRRFEEFLAKQEPANYEEIKQKIIDRDHRDMTREVAPLMQAVDAILIDSSNLTIDEVLMKLNCLYKEVAK